MTTVYMSQQIIRFTDNQLIQGYPNKLVEEGVFTFSSNVINCSLTILQNSYHHVSLEGLNNPNVIQLQEAEKLSCIGSGIENISYNGTDVMFTAWMQVLSISGGVATAVTGGISVSAQKVESSLSPLSSYLTILAVAQCE